MKLISWNVNGLRAAMGKGFMDFFSRQEADIFCIQETKMQAGQLDLEMPGYYQYWNYAEKKGYSGTAIFTKKEPMDVKYGIGIEEHDHEGRVITLEFEDFYMVTCYTPNSQNELKRLDYRMQWEDDFKAYLKKLEESKPVVLCGDLNVAHKEIDLKNLILMENILICLQNLLQKLLIHLMIFQMKNGWRKEKKILIKHLIFMKFIWEAG